MCFKYFRKLFNKVSLYDAPFPKEDNPKLYNVPTELRQDFYNHYNVSDPEWFTINVGINIDPNFTGAAHSINDVITFNPIYANIPTLAHEICHSLYSKLTQEQQNRFPDLLPEIVALNKMIELAIDDYSIRDGWENEPIVEAHAQIYRFFGKQMPSELYEFYPHLI